MDTTMTNHSLRRYVLFGALAAIAIAILVAVYSGPRIEAAMTHPTPRQSDQWYLETRTQPVVRDRWYVEAKAQPAARDQWYIEAKAQPVAYERWYLDMPGAREHSIVTATAGNQRSIEAKAQPAADGSTHYRADRAYFRSVARDYAPYMYRLLEMNMMEDPAASGLAPTRDPMRRTGAY